jgi:hypothetical protein
MSIKCIKCLEVINPLRIKALPNTKVCVECSTAGAYQAVTTTEGNGDHTWNDLQILTQDQFDNYQKSEEEIRTMKNLPKSNNPEHEDGVPMPPSNKPAVKKRRKKKNNA